MSNTQWARPSWILYALLFAGTGCQDVPSRVPSPSWEPSSITKTAFQQLDTNEDRVLDAEELKAAPGLAAGIPLIDSDSDGVLSEDELANRIATYRRLAIGRTSPSFRFLYNGRPLANAKVEFVPEPFLTGVIKPAKATTNAEGLAYPQTEDEEFPGMQVGYYRVQVSATDKPLPSKYKDSSLLGIEVSGTNDNPNGYKTIEFRLDNK